MTEAEINKLCEGLPVTKYRYVFRGGHEIRRKRKVTKAGVCVGVRYTLSATGITRAPVALVVADERYCTDYLSWPVADTPSQGLDKIGKLVQQAVTTGHVYCKFCSECDCEAEVKICTIGDVPANVVRKLAIKTAAAECRKLRRQLEVEYRKVTAVLRKGDAVSKYRRSK